MDKQITQSAHQRLLKKGDDEDEDGGIEIPDSKKKYFFAVFIVFLFSFFWACWFASCCLFNGFFPLDLLFTFGFPPLFLS